MTDDELYRLSMIVKLNKPLSTDNIDDVLEFLPFLEVEGFEPVKEVVRKPGHFGYQVWNPVLERLHSALYENGLVIPFDWSSWQDEARKYLESPELLGSADLDTIRKLFTVHVRKKRFCEGHFTAMVKIGHIRMLLKRLEEIREVFE